MRSDNFELDNFLYGFLFLLLAFFVYKFNRFWVKEKNKKAEGLDNFDKGPRMLNEIVGIGMFIMIAIVFFLKAFKLW